MSEVSDSDFRFLPKYRLKLRTDFERVYEQGAVASDGVLVIHGIRNELDHSRIGLSIAKRVGSAPIRNRWKRWMREAFRLHRSKLPVGLDIIIRPRRGAEGSFHAVEKSILHLFRQIDRKL